MLEQSDIYHMICKQVFFFLFFKVQINKQVEARNKDSRRPCGPKNDPYVEKNEKIFRKINQLSTEFSDFKRTRVKAGSKSTKAKINEGKEELTSVERVLKRS